MKKSFYLLPVISLILFSMASSALARKAWLYDSFCIVDSNAKGTCGPGSKMVGIETNKEVDGCKVDGGRSITWYCSIDYGMDPYTRESLKHLDSEGNRTNEDITEENPYIHECRSCIMIEPVTKNNLCNGLNSINMPKCKAPAKVRESSQTLSNDTFSCGAKDKINWVCEIVNNTNPVTVIAENKCSACAGSANNSVKPGDKPKGAQSLTSRLNELSKTSKNNVKIKANTKVAPKAVVKDNANLIPVNTTAYWNNETYKFCKKFIEQNAPIENSVK